jgi:hypothetical protein
MALDLFLFMAAFSFNFKNDWQVSQFGRDTIDTPGVSASLKRRAAMANGSKGDYTRPNG